MKQLTLDKVSTMKFVLTLHLNMGRQHSRCVTNEEYGLSIVTVSEKPMHRIMRKVMVADLLPGYECDLLRPNRKLALLEFIEKFNDAVKAAKKGDKANVTE